MGVVATPSLDFLYGTLDTLYLLPVYSYGRPLSIDTKMSTFFLLFVRTQRADHFIHIDSPRNSTETKKKKNHHIHVNKRHTKAEVIFQAISDYQVHNVSKQEDEQIY